MRGTLPRPSSAISRSSHPSTFPSIDPSSTPSFTSSRPLPPTRSTRSSPSSTFRPAISSKPQPEKPLSGLQQSPGRSKDLDRLDEQLGLHSRLANRPVAQRPEPAARHVAGYGRRRSTL